MVHVRRVSLVVSVLALLAGVVGGAAAQSTRQKALENRSIPFDCGGWFSGFAIHSSGRLYGFGDVFGTWRSDDAGQSWRFLQDDMTVSDVFVNGMAVAPGNADHVYFLSPSRLWKSTNGGTTWQSTLAGLESRRSRGSTPVFIHPNSDSELWVAANRTFPTGQLWRSINGGSNWTKVGGTTFDGVVPLTIYIRKEFPDQVFVGARGGLWFSPDRGVTWTQIWNNGGQINPFTGNPPSVHAIVRRADGVGYVATDVGGFRMTATNYSLPATYQLTRTVSWWSGWGPTNASVLADGTFVTGGDGDGSGSVSNLEDAQRVSRDGGQTWTELPMVMAGDSPVPIWLNTVTAGSTAPGGRDFVVQDPSQPSRWFMTGGMAPVVSEDSGRTWRYFPQNNGLAGVMTYKARFARSDSSRMFVPSSDLGAFVVSGIGKVTEVAGSSYRRIPRLVTVHEVMPSANGQIVVAAGVDQGLNQTVIHRSTDGGINWTSLNLTNSGLPPSSEGITRAVMAPNNPSDYLVLLGSGGPNRNPGLWRTTNGGFTFRKVVGIPEGLNTGTRYHPENAFLETDGVSMTTRYLSVRGDRVYRSVNSGADWAPTVSMPFGQDWIISMAVDRAQAGRLWVGGGWRGLARSDDGGDTWMPIPGFTQADQVDAASGRIAVWGRRGNDPWNKLYYSPDQGRSWTELSRPGFRQAALRELAVDPFRPGIVYVSGISINIVINAQRG